VTVVAGFYDPLSIGYFFLCEDEKIQARRRCEDVEQPEMTKQFIDLMCVEHAKWETILAMVPESQMDMPGPAGDGEWSVKDILAHIAWYEREMAGAIEKHALVGSELWQLPPDQRNDVIFKENKDRPLNEIRDESRQVHDRLMQSLESLTEEDLHDAGRFLGMPAEWKPWQVIATNTFEHYQHHTAQVDYWLMRI
jgi:uncharacterized damage-inducible protein DinB